MADPFDVECKTSELAKRLHITVSTVRKYAEELEKSGYEFERDGTGSRIYRQHDYDSFLLLKWICEKTKVGLDHAAFMVVTRNKYALQTASPENPTQSTDIFTDARLEERAALPDMHILQELRHSIMQSAAAQEMIISELREARRRENELINEIRELKNRLRIESEKNSTCIDEFRLILSQLLEKKKKKKKFQFF